MSQTPFVNGRGILVTTRGPGKVHLYSYGSSNLPGHFGTIETTRGGVSHFVISHSYTFTKFAFYWDGQGEATYRIGENPKKQPVGKSWSAASWVPWGGIVEPLDVSPEYFQGAVNRDNYVTCFLLPENLEY